MNCIHPSPDEPEFASAEMLYVDPDACVDCGACVSACPVGAIVPDSKLVPEQLPFIPLNRAYYPDRHGQKVPPTSKLAPVPPAPEIQRGGMPLTVAIVGSGPAAMYAADELLTQHGVRVNVFEKLPTPYGLVRAGVAPDHPHTKKVTKLFDTIANEAGFTFYLNVEVGKHVSHAELLQHHHAVLYAVGAPHDRRLDIDGMDNVGVHTATELVAWYNGHPDFVDLPVDLSCERVVLVGNGNVAMDVARILTADADELARTDIADHALAVLRESKVREVIVAARRGPADSAFTLPELIGLTAHRSVVLDEYAQGLVREDLAGEHDELTRNKLDILATLSDADGDERRIRLAYRLTPKRVVGDGRVQAVEFVRTGTEETHRFEAGLLATSIGYHGRAVPDLPFDEKAGVVPNDDGRVTDCPGTYVAGWIKRGPTGFIGTNKSCAQHTVHQLVEDFNSGALADPAHRHRSELQRLARERQPQLVDLAGWHAIDAAEIARGAGVRPRDKFTRIAPMLAVAATAPRPTWRDRLREAITV
ncbi:hypothetical protein MBRU_02235 [Mycolicibacterium brumae DSM 44177]|nr:hypothetical protein MBRU_02235 [Mycolicibacterium brumae DSM 44177]